MVERSRSNRAIRHASRDSRASGEAVSRWGGSGYFDASRRPLEILFFLLPFIALYEYELVRVLRSPEGLVTNGAHLAILRLFDAIGVDAVALSLPGVLLVVLFLAKHVVSRGPWIVDLSVVGRMYLESAALALPLVVFSAAVARLAPAAGVADFASLPFAARVAVAIGAGLYEELVFRMVLVGLLLWLVRDVLEVERRMATSVAIVIGALAFTAYHPLRDAGGALEAQRVVFYLGGGIYFGILYLRRGFGIAAATHALFDLAAAALVEGAPPGSGGG